jgi:hypothetical protein
MMCWRKRKTETKNHLAWSNNEKNRWIYKHSHIRQGCMIKFLSIKLSTGAFHTCKWYSISKDIWWDIGVDKKSILKCVSNYVIFIAFPWQQWLRERASMLCLYVHCLSCYNLDHTTYQRPPKEPTYWWNSFSILRGSMWPAGSSTLQGFSGEPRATSWVMVASNSDLIDRITHEKSSTHLLSLLYSKCNSSSVCGSTCLRNVGKTLSYTV